MPDYKQETLDPIVVNEPKETETYTFTKKDIENISIAAVKRAIALGIIPIESGTLVEANPELVGTESLLQGLEVAGTKYKNPPEVSANPTLAGSEALLEALQIGSTKYKAPNEVTANPTLAGTETELTGLQIGNTKYKAGGGGAAIHGYLCTFPNWSSGDINKFVYFTDADDITDITKLAADLHAKGKSYPIWCARYNSAGYIYNFLSSSDGTNVYAFAANSIAVSSDGYKIQFVSGSSSQLLGTGTFALSFKKLF